VHEGERYPEDVEVGGLFHGGEEGRLDFFEAALGPPQVDEQSPVAEDDVGIVTRASKHLGCVVFDFVEAPVEQGAEAPPRGCVGKQEPVLVLLAQAGYPFQGGVETGQVADLESDNGHDPIEPPLPPVAQMPGSPRQRRQFG
jgi:hypothetical protein